MPKSIFSDRYEQFRALLVNARTTARITQKELAKKLGRPQSYVSKYERGERRLDVVELLDIARALGINPSKLIQRLEGEGRTTRRPRPL